MKLSVISLLILLILSCNTDNKAYKHRLEGKKLAEEGKYQKAIIEYKEALQINPSYDTVALNIGMCYWRLDNREVAKKYFLKTIKINPKYDKAYLNLGRVSLSSDERILNFKKAIKHTTNDSLIGYCYKLIGDVYIKEKEFKTALNYYNKSNDIYPEKISLIRMRGTLNSRLQNFYKSNKLHEQALSLDTNDAETYNDYGASLQRQGKIELAIEMLEKAITLSSKNHKTLYNLAYANFTLSNYTVALLKIERCLELKPENQQALLLKGKIILLESNAKKGCEIFESLCLQAQKSGFNFSNADAAPILIIPRHSLEQNISFLNELALTYGKEAINQEALIEAYWINKHICN